MLRLLFYLLCFYIFKDKVRLVVSSMCSLDFEVLTIVLSARTVSDDQDFVSSRETL